jgi:hypothetical protein
MVGAGLALSARAGLATHAEGSPTRLLGPGEALRTIHAPLGNGWLLNGEPLTVEAASVTWKSTEPTQPDVSSAQLVGTMLTSTASSNGAGTLSDQTLLPPKLRRASEDASHVRSDELTRAVGRTRWSVVAEGAVDQALTGTSVTIPGRSNSRGGSRRR